MFLFITLTLNFVLIFFVNQVFLIFVILFIFLIIFGIIKFIYVLLHQVIPKVRDQINHYFVHLS
jgi:hypothetical protein